MFERLYRIGFLGIALLPLLAGGQQKAGHADPPAGTVTGQVFCLDTNAPARFALVTLERIPGVKGSEGKQDGGDSAMNATATTDLQGRFAMNKVPPGHYFVLAELTGYLDPLTQFDQKQLQAITEETRKELIRLVPTVSVEANQVAEVNLRLERASEIGGTVLYDDGSPAVGMRMQLLRKDKDGNLVEVVSDLSDRMGPLGSHASTDGRGRYQMIGAPAGEYAVRASLPTDAIKIGGLLSGEGMISATVNSRGGSGMRMYSGNTFRKKDAKFIKVGDGEQVSGVDITIPLTGLHRIQGTVTAKRDGHALNQGRVQLLYADDREQVRIEGVAEDGSFVLDYIPADKYILRVSNGADTEETEIHPFPDMTVKQNKPVHEYGDAEAPLLVQGDVSGVEVALPEAADKSAPQQP